MTLNREGVSVIRAAHRFTRPSQERSSKYISSERPRVATEGETKEVFLNTVEPAYPEDKAKRKSNPAADIET